ncbi:MAG: alpha/beta hydrolase [Prevotella sp.]|nr:alpha/beta hydrolase [Prevotella sp.]
MKATKRLLAIFMAMTAMAAAAQQGKTYNLWPKGAPNANGNPTDTAKVTVFLPDAKKATGRAVVICPGGGYGFLAMDHEGYDWAPFFNREGIAAIVLKYRMPRGNCEVPVSDAEEAMRLVRRNAKQWNINPQQVGIMGSSAGGHLASTIATHATGDAAPNFQILFYPVITMDPAFTHQGSHDNLLGEKPKKKLERLYSNELQVTRVTPRAFIALSDDDTLVLPINSANYYQECIRHDVPATVHVYPTGGHGWGYRESFDYHIELVLELKAWLKSF